jgi:nucleotide-binding universal stress UspA family protein
MPVSYTKIMVALDGSGPAERALEHASGLAQRFNASLHLLRVIDESQPREMPVPQRAETSQDVIAAHQREDERIDSQAYLRQLASALSASGMQVSTGVREGSPAPEILAEAQSSQADLVVITSYGRTASVSRPRGSVFGGVADEVLRNTRVPVLVVHP